MDKIMVAIFVTAKDKRQAAEIAQALLEAKLVACANILDGVESMFWWEGKIDSSKEALLILKTDHRMFSQVEAKIKSLHSYENPEVIAMPIVEGSAAYLQWIKDSLK